MIIIYIVFQNIYISSLMKSQTSNILINLINHHKLKLIYHNIKQNLKIVQESNPSLFIIIKIIMKNYNNKTYVNLDSYIIPIFIQNLFLSLKIFFYIQIIFLFLIHHIIKKAPQK